MIKVVWTVLCSQSVIDQTTNNISLFQVLEEVQLDIKKKTDKEKQLIQIPFAFQWVTLWENMRDKKSTSSVKDIVVSPTGKTVFESKEYEINLLARKRHRFIRTFAGLPLEESGRYEFRTQLRAKEENVWTDAASVPLQVVIRVEAT